MGRFLVDEDMPRSTAVELRKGGHIVVDVRDVGLRGRPDHDVFAYAQAHGLVLVSADLGFANVVRFPPGTHSGIVVLRVPNSLTTQQVHAIRMHALTNLHDDDLRGALLIVEVGRMRLRRPRAPDD